MEYIRPKMKVAIQENIFIPVPRNLSQVTAVARQRFLSFREFFIHLAFPFCCVRECRASEAVDGKDDRDKRREDFILSSLLPTTTFTAFTASGGICITHLRERMRTKRGQRFPVSHEGAQGILVPSMTPCAGGNTTRRWYGNFLGLQ